MTDTGQVPGEGLPENAGVVEQQPGMPGSGAYTFLDPSAHGVEEDDLLLMPGAQGAWSDPQIVPPAPQPEQFAPGAEAAAPDVVPAPELAAPTDLGVPEPGIQAVAEPVGQGMAPVPAAVEEQPAAMASAVVEQPAPAAMPPSARRPLHMGPPLPDNSGGVVRSLADRGPAGVPSHPLTAQPLPGPAATGAEHADVPREDPQPVLPGPQLGEIPPQAGAPWGPQAPQPAVVAAPAETVVPVAEPPAPVAPAAERPEPAQAPVVVPAPVEAVPQPAEEAQQQQQQPAAQPVRVQQPEAAPVTEPAVVVVPEPERIVQAQPEAAPVAEAPEQQPGASAPRTEPAAVPVLVPEPEPEPAVTPEPVSEPLPPAAVELSAEQPAPPAPPTEAVAASETASAPEEGAVPEAVVSAPEEGVVPETVPVPDAVSVSAPEAAPAPEATPVPETAPVPEAIPAVEEGAAPEAVPAPEAPPVSEAAPMIEATPVVPAAPAAEALPAPETAPAVETAPVQEAAPAAEAPPAPEAVPAPDLVPAPETASVSEAAPVLETAPAVEVTPAPETAPAAEATPVPAPAPEAEATPAPETAPETAPVPEAIPVPDAAPAPETPAVPETAPEAEAEQAPAVPRTPPAPGYDDAEREAVLRVMRERRDIRNGFRADPIPHEVLLRVLEAAHTAPSVGHSQPWDFVVIRSAETRRTMHELAQRQRDAYAKSLPKGRAKQFKELKIEAILDTPVNIVVTADPTRGGRHTLGRHTQPQMAPYSSALAVENLWLAARAEGLGVGWVSFFDEREMVRALGLPEHLEVVAYLCVGYVDEFPEEPELMQSGWSKRRPLSWVVHEETYGRRALPGEEPHDLLAETVANIRPLDAKALGEAWERQKRMTKPAGALGMLEIISAQLSGLSRMCPPPIPEPAAVAVFAGDHGVHAQGVTAWPQEVTGQMVANFLGGGAVCNAFANQVGAEVCVIDVGVASDLPATPGLLPRKVRPGTADFTTGPALTREEVLSAIEVGIETARDLVAAGNKALLTGEMGIANTTVSAALISVYTSVDPVEITGRGTGINDEMHARKVDVVRRALELHAPDPSDPIGVLAAVGGLEHAALVGLILGGASLRTPVLLDGVSAGAAALVARAIAPEALAACIAGHRSAEPGHVAALNKLGLRPLVDLDLRLGEGTGALLALPVVQSAARAMHEVATFDSAGVTEK
ncbi:nicotinate-nucleotide--dimethylbenzimidazole phosphoribosyltransferase [Streptomyces jumonjinensis]|uniref:Nicotinate-nucleotide--dimethylbenzimidazole phosphoribosyltransferase n=1 Tax=Streptomyces jumonjinensis TaxID=1945 RepID=A0A646KF41_STRJU|nr:nicotinate-nucleotide--dimethylbenzimidazole phosphoribosyltransferase [Streptomyces jumonjinensis]MQT00597.1 nicotinate-nucleotide--dimethylbenzimidazole phosphoribosyltransferase [Streptomyces jumonjinensis]